MHAFSLKCVRSDISHRYDKLTIGITAYLSCIETNGTPMVIDKMASSFNKYLLQKK